MAVEFAIIRNPNNLLLKHEVWIKGDAEHKDDLGQPAGRYTFCQKARTFYSRKNAESFVQYQQERRQFVETL